MNKWLMVAGFFGFSGVGLGAFAAHSLKNLLTPEQLAVFQTGVQYQLWHALALLIVALWLSRDASRWLRAAAWCFALGTPLFSGSLYLLTLAGWRVGLVTPLGGLLLMAGWSCLMVQGGRHKVTEHLG